MTFSMKLFSLTQIILLHFFDALTATLPKAAAYGSSSFFLLPPPVSLFPKFNTCSFLSVSLILSLLPLIHS